jgi:hypothetical protein
MYVKQFQSMYDGTLGTQSGWEALVTFQQLLILADAGGNVDMTKEAIANRTSIPLDIIEKGIHILEAPDRQSRTPDNEGRRILRLAPDRDWGWFIVNYVKYSNIRNQEERREYMRLYQRDRRKKLKEINENNECKSLQSLQKFTKLTSNTSKQCKPNQNHNQNQESELRIKNNNTHKKEEKKKENIISKPRDVPKEVWDDFLALRKKKNAPVTATALKGLRSEGEKAMRSLSQVMQICCANGWQGFKADWIHEQNKEGWLG